MAKILFSDLHTNLSIAKLPSQFSGMGAECFSVGYPNSVISQSSAYKQKYGIEDAEPDVRDKVIVSAVSFAVNHCKPDFLLCNDEAMLLGLIQVKNQLLRRKNSLSDKQVTFLNLLETSLLPKSEHYLRHMNVELANKSGFDIPGHHIATSLDGFYEKLEGLPKPCFVKVNFHMGGMGVFPVTEQTDPQEIGRHFEDGIILNASNPLFIQMPAEGKELTISFAAWRGELLGYVVTEPLAKMFENGPSSVIRNCYRPKWEAPLRKLVKELGMSGFGGLDVFEKPEDDVPTVIEVNPRPTHNLPSTRSLDNDLVSLFNDALCGEADTSRSVQHVENAKTLALFPDEVIRDPNSQYLKNLPLDGPWEDPGLVKAMASIYKKIVQLSKQNPMRGSELSPKDIQNAV